MSVFLDPYEQSYPPGLYVTPVLTSIAPATGVMAVSQTVTLTGSGFFTTTQGYVDGVQKPTAFVSSTVIRVTWTPPVAATVQVTARNGSKVTAQKAFTVTATGTRAAEPAKASGKPPKGRD